MFDKILGKIIDKLFGSYFNGIKNELVVINERLDQLEAKKPLIFTIPNIGPIQSDYNCKICGNPHCFNTHITC